MKKRDPVRYARLWGLCAALSCVIPPLGLILTLIGLAGEKRLRPKGSWVLLNAGEITLGFSLFEVLIVILTSVGSTEYTAVVIGMSAYFLCGAAAGLLMLSAHFRLTRWEQRCGLLNDVICEGHITDVERLAECVGLSPRATMDLLDEMGRLHLLKHGILKREDGIVSVEGTWASVRYTCPDCGAAQFINPGCDLVCRCCGSAVRR